MNIYQKLAEIRKQEDVKYMQKDKGVGTGANAYKAITHDQVTSILNPYFSEYGVMVVPRQISGELNAAGKTTASGIPYTNYIGMYEINFVNIDDPTDKVSVILGAVGEDTNDKGPGKAHSYATKYAMLKILSIETGDGEESRQESKPEYISLDQAIVIKDMIKASGADQLKFLEFIKAKSVSKITANNYNVAIKALEAKEKENAKS